MVRTEKTVFISYRRVDRWQALAVFKDLTQHGYDVFIDYDGIGSGDFERAIVDNIRARAHFVLVLTPTALMRSDDPADWMRREIEVALDARRNLVPLLLDGFTFEAPLVVERLQGSLEPLRHCNALRVPEDSAYFDTAMGLLRSKYLAIEVSAVTQPASPHAQQIAHEQQDAASKAAALTRQDGGQSNWEGIGSLAQVYAEALKLYGRGAKLGFASAQAALGIMYKQGRGGLAKDDAEAVKWFRKAAEQGNAEAQTNLGLMYEQGMGGLANDDAEAVKWYRKAAEQGNAEGQVHFGSMYVQGKGGLPRNDPEAVKWYRKAAEQGYEPAQIHLAHLERTDDL